MPTLNPPNLQSFASVLPGNLAMHLAGAFQAQDKYGRDIANALSSALVKGDTLQVWTPYTAASPLAVPSDWQTPTLSGGWSNFGGSYEVASYRKDTTGRVTIRGLVKSAAAGLVFTLPTGYIPASSCTFATIVNAASDVFARLDVKGVSDAAPGQVTILGTAPSTYGSINCSFYCSDFQPYVGSVFPVDLAWPFTQQPLFLGIQAQDVTTASTPSNISLAQPDWVMVSQGGRQLVRIRNIPGLLPSKSYALTVWGF